MINPRIIVQQFNGISKSRRSFFILILLTTGFFYGVSKWFPRQKTHRSIKSDQCLQMKLEEYSGDFLNMDAIVNHQPIQYGDVVSLPFVGNGFIGVSFSSQSDIQLIKDVNSTFTSSGFSPLIQISSHPRQDVSAMILHMKDAFIKRIQCFDISETHSVYVSQRVYAHRRRSSLIIQDIEIINPSQQIFEFDLRRKEFYSKINSKRLDQQEVQSKSNTEIFSMTTNLISTGHRRSLINVILTNKFLLNQPIQAGSRNEKTIFTVVKFSPEFHDDDLTNKTSQTQWMKNLQEQAKEELFDALSISSNKLFEEHRNVWSSIWKSGFSISRSLAPSTLNGDVINRTIYYVLSSTPSSMNDGKIDQTKKNLFRPDGCYESHSTLIGEKLWRAPGDDLAISQFSNLWRSTLRKGGCAKLMLNGVDGVFQSMLLSIGGLRFRDQHLEMRLDPKELHRDMIFRLIQFGQQSHLNISVVVESDNRAAINVSIDRENDQVYACDAGCIDPPKKLKNEPIRLPVKLTNPQTAILYVTDDFEHITQLKETLHVKEVNIAPPHGHDIIALHRHGHKLGGLPIIFWIFLAFLILVFHLFLLKIVLNEMGFFKQTSSGYTRTRAH